MRSSDWGADVCSSDRLAVIGVVPLGAVERDGRDATRIDVGQDYRLGHFEELLLLLLPVWFTFLEEGGGTLPALDRTSVVEGKRLSVRVERGGRRIAHTSK